MANAQSSYRIRESVLLEVGAEGGMRGVGEAALPAGASFRNNADAIDGYMAEVMSAIVGRKAGDGRSSLRLPALEAGTWSAALICAIETALGDLASRAADQPLYRWLAARASLPIETDMEMITTNGLVDLAVPEEAAASAAALVAEGFRTIKLKVGGDPQESVARVAAVRAAVGPDVELRCDANSAWNAEDALVFLNDSAPHNLALCEEPLENTAADGYRGLASLRAKSPVPLAVDESTRSRDALTRVVAAEAADAVVVKPMASGLAEGLAMMRFARESRLPAIVTTTFDLAPGTAVAMHLAALADAPRPASGLATVGLVEAPLGTDVPEVRDGQVVLSDAPGLGVALDLDAVERYAVGPWEESPA